MEKKLKENNPGSLPSIAIMLTSLSVSAALIYGYYLAGVPSFDNAAAAARWTAIVLGLAGFVFLWFYLMLEPLVSRLSENETVNRRLHQLLGFLAALLATLEPLVLILTGKWNLLSGANLGDKQIYVLVQRLAVLLMLTWVIITARKRDSKNRVPPIIHALNYTAMLGLIIYWKMAGGIYAFWFGKILWQAVAVSFSILVAWRLIPGENKNSRVAEKTPEQLKEKSPKPPNP